MSNSIHTTDKPGVQSPPVTTETTKYPDMTQMDDGALYGVLYDKQETTMTIMREYARQMVAADREKVKAERRRDFTDGGHEALTDLRDHATSRAERSHFDRAVWKRVAEEAERHHTRWETEWTPAALARPSDASAVRELTEEGVAFYLLSTEAGRRLRAKLLAFDRAEVAREALTKCAMWMNENWSTSAAKSVYDLRDREYPHTRARCVLSTGEVWEREDRESSVPYRVITSAYSALQGERDLDARVGGLLRAGLTEDVPKLVAFAKEGK